MIVLDSSCWIEYLQNTPLAEEYADAIRRPADLRIPAISITEVYRFVLREEGEPMAIQAAGLMLRSEVIELSASLAIRAATLGHQYRLPLADSNIYAASRSLDIDLWTQDADFKGLPGVQYFEKK